MAAEAPEARLVREAISKQTYVLVDGLAWLWVPHVEALALPALSAGHVDEHREAAHLRPAPAGVRQPVPGCAGHRACGSFMSGLVAAGVVGVGKARAMAECDLA